MSAHVEDRLSELLDGELPAPERVVVEGHLRECAVCARRLQELAAVDAAARDVGIEAPAGYFDSFPARVRARLQPVRKPAWRPPVWAWAAAAALLLAVVTPLSVLAPWKPPAAPEIRPAAKPALEDAAPDAERTPRASKDAEASLAKGGARETLERKQDEAARSGRPEVAAQQPQAAAVPAEGQARPQPVAPAPAARDQFAQAPRRPQPSHDRERRGPRQQQQLPQQTPLAGSRADAPAAAPPPATLSPAGVEEGLAMAEQARNEAGVPGAAVARREASKTVGGVSRQERAAAQAEEATVTPVSADASYRELRARNAASPQEARALREAWREFARNHAGDARADEARVRTIEAGLLAYRLGRDEADLLLARSDGRDYLARADAPQAERVRRAFESAGR